MSATALPLIGAVGALSHTFSASQIDTFLLCPRKWAWRYVAKIKAPDAASAQVGTAMHSDLEDYLSGKPLDFMHVVNGVNVGNVAASGVHFLPDPNIDGKTEEEVLYLATAIVIEDEFNFVSERGFRYTGRKDLEVADSGLFPGLVEAEKLSNVHGRTFTPAVGDHKSTSSLAWAKSKAELEWDVQSNLYAYELIKRKRAPYIDLVWIYYQTKGGKASKRVHLRVTQEHAQKAFRGIEHAAAEMTGIIARAPARPEETDPTHPVWVESVAEYVRTQKANLAACSKYGGCNFEHQCRLTPEEKMRARMSGENDSWFDSVKARAEAQDGGTPAPMTTTPEVPAVASAALPPWLQTESPPLVETAAPALPATNPPESTLPAQELPPPVAEKPAKKEPKEKKPKKDPKGADVHAATSGAFNEAPAAASAPAPSKASPAPSSEGFTLYINCIPLDAEYQYLSDFIATAQETIRKETSEAGEPVADYRFIAYGQGGGALAIAVMQAIEEVKPPAISVTTAADETRHVLAALMAKASFIVMGLAS